jgi:hypothetical protein
MTVKKVKRWTIVCDQCGATGYIADERRRPALHTFTEWGWDLGRGKIADLCPPCSAPVGASENACQDCGVDNPVWFAPNELWNRVMGGPDAHDDPGGYLCPVCFIVHAKAAGIDPTGWFLTEEQLDTEASA